MEAKETLGDRLRKDAAERKQKADKILHEEQTAREKKLQKQASALAKEIIGGLEEKIDEAAKRNYSYRLFYYGSIGNELTTVQSRARWEIDAWAKKNGMHTHFSHDPGSWDWPSSDYYAICWKDHSKDKRYY